MIPWRLRFAEMRVSFQWAFCKRGKARGLLGRYNVPARISRFPKNVLRFEAEMLGYYVKLYFCTLIAFFAIDMVWLGLVAHGFYKKQLGHLLRPNPNWTAAIVFYLMFVVGLLACPACHPARRRRCDCGSLVLGCR